MRRRAGGAAKAPSDGRDVIYAIAAKPPLRRRRPWKTSVAYITMRVRAWWCAPPCAKHMEVYITGLPRDALLHVLCTWRSTRGEGGVPGGGWGLTSDMAAQQSPINIATTLAQIYYAQVHDSDLDDIPINELPLKVVEDHLRIPWHPPQRCNMIFFDHMDSVDCMIEYILKYYARERLISRCRPTAIGCWTWSSKNVRSC